MKKKYRYMHLSDGYPAIFDGEMILRSWIGLSQCGAVPTYPDYETIRKHRKLSTAARKALGWPLSRYSHVRVEV